VSRTRYPAVDAVAALIRPRDQLVDTDDGRTTRVPGPCLLQLLIIYRHAVSTSRGAGGNGAGTVPLNTEALDLLNEINLAAHTWAQPDHLDIDVKAYAVAPANRPGKPITPPLGLLLRACAVKASTEGHDGIADGITRLANQWARRIEEIVDKERDHRDLRGTCPTCGADQVLEERDDPGNRRRLDGRGTFRRPALILVAPRLDETEGTLCCLACGWHAPVSAAAVHLLDQGAVVVHTTTTRPDDHQVDDAPGQAA
jgi:hypothetical protein